MPKVMIKMQYRLLNQSAIVPFLIDYRKNMAAKKKKEKSWISLQKALWNLNSA